LSAARRRHGRGRRWCLGASAQAPRAMEVRLRATLHQRVASKPSLRVSCAVRVSQTRTCAANHALHAAHPLHMSHLCPGSLPPWPTRPHMSSPLPVFFCPGHTRSHTHPCILPSGLTPGPHHCPCFLPPGHTRSHTHPCLLPSWHSPGQQVHLQPRLFRFLAATAALVITCSHLVVEKRCYS
jgi:hypothetical protein